MSSHTATEIRVHLLSLPEAYQLTTDASWHWLVSLDPDQLLKTRINQKALCARYGRQSWTQWANLPVTELMEASRAFVQLLEKEKLLMED